MNPFKSFFLFFGAVVLLSSLLGCQSTKISSVWRDDSFRRENIKKVFIICHLKDDLLRRKGEDLFAKHLRRRGVDSIESYRFYPTETDPDKGEITRRLKREGYSNILIAKLLDEKTVTIDNMPACVSPNDWNSRGWYPYYEACSGGKYTITVDTLRIETALFEAETDKLLWATQTYTELTSNPTDEDIEQWVTLVIKNMFGK